MNKRLPIPIFIVLCVFLIVVLTYIFIIAQEITGLPDWPLLHPFGVLVIVCSDFLSKFGPEKFKNKLYEQTLKLHQRDKIVFFTGTMFFIVAGFVEFFFMKNISDIEGIGLFFINFAIWAGFNKLFGSAELNRIFWTPKKAKNENHI